MLLSVLDRYRDYGLLILRIGFGLSFLAHGVPKLMAGPELWTMLGSSMSRFGITFGYPFWGLMAALSESVGGALLIPGFLFRYACFFMFFTMTVAAMHHLGAGDSYGVMSHAVEAGLVFLSLILIGPGRFSVDAWLCSRKKVEPSLHIPQSD